MIEDHADVDGCGRGQWVGSWWVPRGQELRRSRCLPDVAAGLPQADRPQATESGLKEPLRQT